MRLQGRIVFPEVAPPVDTVQKYRKPHDVEIISYDNKNWNYGGDGYRGGKPRETVFADNAGMPEVYRVYPSHVVPLRCPSVRLWRDLNPALGINQFSSVLNSNFAFTNNTGFPQRKNCLTGGGGTGDPALDQPRVCGGAILTGREVGLYLYIDYINVDEPLPTAQEVLDRGLWFYGTTVLQSGKVNYMMKRGVDGNMHRVRVPIFGRERLHIPLKWLHKLPLGTTIEANQFAGG